MIARSVLVLATGLCLAFPAAAQNNGRASGAPNGAPNGASSGSFNDPTGAPQGEWTEQTSGYSDEQLRTMLRDEMLVGWGGVFDELSQAFPQDYRGFEDDLVARLQAGTLTEDDLAALAYDFYGGLEGDYQAAVKSAPTRLILQLAVERSAILESIHGDARVCSEFVQSDSLSRATLEALTDEQQMQYQRFSNARVRAAIGGLSHPLSREAPTADDLSQLLAAYEKLGGDSSILDDKDGQGPTIRESCEFARTISKAALTLPADAVAALYGNGF